MTPGFYLKTEYRYSTYSGGSASYDDDSIDLDEAFNFIDLERHQVIIGLGARF